MRAHLLFTTAALGLAYLIAPDQMVGMVALIALANGGLALLRQIDEPLYLENGEPAASAPTESKAA